MTDKPINKAAYKQAALQIALVYAGWNVQKSF